MTKKEKSTLIELAEVYNTYRTRYSDYGPYQEVTGEQEKPRSIDAKDILLLEDVHPDSTMHADAPYDARTCVVPLSGDAFYVREGKDQINQKRDAALPPQKKPVAEKKRPAPFELTEVFNKYVPRQHWSGAYNEKIGEGERPRTVDANDFLILMAVDDRYDQNAPVDAATQVIPLKGDNFYVRETKNEIEKRRAAALKA